MSKPKAKKKGYVVLYMLAFLLAASALGVWTWVGSMNERASGVSPSPAAQEPDGTDGPFDSEGFAIVDWEYWQSRNPAIIGWVNVPGTDISQPICKADGSDPDYWNRHDAYGQYNLMGCPFLHADCQGGLTGSANCVVQGHNVGGAGTGMFAAFAQFADDVYAREHRRVLLQTPTCKLELEAWCVEVIPNAGADYSLATAFENDAQFQRYCAERKSAARVVLSDTPDKQMWTFSTCSYLLTPENERTVVHCKLMSKRSVG